MMNKKFVDLFVLWNHHREFRNFYVYELCEEITIWYMSEMILKEWHVTLLKSQPLNSDNMKSLFDECIFLMGVGSP